MHNNLDKEFVEKLNLVNIKIAYNELLKRKTDLLDGKTKIVTGSDGVNYLKFGESIEKHSHIMCSKGQSGRYIFEPFKEVVIPKPPFERDQIIDAKKAKKIRTLSISTIQDTLFQDIIYQVLYPFTETKFNEIDMFSFAYRKNKSSKMAVREIIKCIDQGYKYVLDADIEEFFDNIDHILLHKKVKLFLNNENPLIEKYLYRFINVKKIHEGMYNKYKKNKGVAVKREIGIPQGGVLSGLLANIFLYNFDLYIVKELSIVYDFKYFRYADDFVLLFKNNEKIEEVYEILREYLKIEKLKLHPLGEKTKILNLNSKDILEFLGFEISPKYLKIKDTNIKKFKNRVTRIVNNIDASNIEKYLSNIVLLLNPKIIGLEEMFCIDGYCTTCHKLLKKRSWLGYFMMIDDVRLFRNLDTWIRKLLYNDYHEKTKCHMRKKDLLVIKGKLLSIEKMYYKYKKQEKNIKKIKNGFEYCDCDRYFDTTTKKIVTKEAKANEQ